MQCCELLVISGTVIRKQVLYPYIPCSGGRLHWRITCPYCHQEDIKKGLVVEYMCFSLLLAASCGLFFFYWCWGYLLFALIFLWYLTSQSMRFLSLHFFFRYSSLLSCSAILVLRETFIVLKQSAAGSFPNHWLERRHCLSGSILRRRISLCVGRGNAFLQKSMAWFIILQHVPFSLYWVYLER